MRPRGTPFIVCDCSSRGTPLYIRFNMPFYELYEVGDGRDEGDEGWTVDVEGYKGRITGRCPQCKEHFAIQLPEGNYSQRQLYSQLQLLVRTKPELVTIAKGKRVRIIPKQDRKQRIEPRSFTGIPPTPDKVLRVDTLQREEFVMVCRYAVREGVMEEQFPEWQDHADDEVFAGYVERVYKAIDEAQELWPNRAGLYVLQLELIDGVYHLSRKSNGIDAFRGT